MHISDNRRTLSWRSAICVPNLGATCWKIDVVCFMNQNGPSDRLHGVLGPCFRRSTVSVKAWFSGCPSVRSSGQILLLRYLMNGLSNLDENLQGIFTIPTDDLIRFLRSKVISQGQRSQQYMAAKASTSTLGCWSLIFWFLLDFCTRRW